MSTWRHKIGSSQKRLREVNLGSQSLGYAEVSQLDYAVLSQKHVLGLDISVEDVFRVHQQDSDHDLRHPSNKVLNNVVPVHYLFFRKALARCFVLRNYVAERASLSIFHHDVNGVRLDKTVKIPYNRWAFEHLQQRDLVLC